MRERLAFILLLLFHFWDIYLPGLGLRVLDIAGLGIIVIAYFTGACRGSPTQSPAVTAIGISILIVYAALSILKEMASIRPVMGIGLGIVVYLIMSRLDLHAGSIYRATGNVLAISLAFFSIQFVAFYTIGRVFDISDYLGTQSRIYNSDISLFRPAGLFQEPNSFCQSCILLLGLRWLYRPAEARKRFRIDRLTSVTLAAILLSFSLYGMLFVGCVLVGLFAANVGLLVKGRLDRSALTWYTIFIVLALVGAVIALEGPVEIKNEHWASAINTSVSRFTRLDDDNSYRDRYLGKEELLSKDQDAWIASVFGHGISVTRFQDFRGANGYSFLIYSFGWAGTIACAALLASLIVKCRRRDRLVALFIVVFVSLSYQIYTYFFWWAFLALAFNAAAQRTGAGFQPTRVRFDPHIRPFARRLS